MAIFIAGTGTDVGKTFFSALCMARYGNELGLKYIKPVQSGTDSDRETVASLSGLGASHFLSELEKFSLAASPHYAAECERKHVDIKNLLSRLSAQSRAKVLIELAGGLEVPLTRNGAEYYTNLNLIHDVGLPVVLIASTGLGTINHTVLSWKVLQQAAIPCAGIFFIGRDNPLRSDNIRTIVEMTGVENLGEFILPEEKFSAEEFQKAAAGFDPMEKIKALLQ